MRIVIKWVLLIVLLCTVGWLTNLAFKKVEAGKSTKERLSTMPELLLITLDSTTINVSAFIEKSLVLIYFNSECEHCRYEAKDIKNNIASFSKVSIVFMSSESLANILDFAETTGLKNHNNIFFTQISSSDAFAAFGNLSVPHIFIYGHDKKLRKEFKGETKAEAILKYLI
ncbi:MAG TPA: redoxin domain-containing protein [Cyclobacteriaceae bacterium]|nr:redoxin domain-containing protein [Cyclobacteriaceae bacterium]